MTSSVCLKVSNLRQIGYESLKQWLENPNNVYTGRGGRIFIKNKEPGEMERFSYPESKWANPFKVKDDCNLKKTLRLYVVHLFCSGLIYDIEELDGKTLGCFCLDKTSPDGHAACHAQILVELLNRCYEPVERFIAMKK